MKKNLHFPLTEHFDNFTSLPDPKVLFLMSNFPIIRIVSSNSEMQKISFPFLDHSIIFPYNETFLQVTPLKQLSQ